MEYLNSCSYKWKYQFGAFLSESDLKAQVINDDRPVRIEKLHN